MPSFGKEFLRHQRPHPVGIGRHTIVLVGNPIVERKRNLQIKPLEKNQILHRQVGEDRPVKLRAVEQLGTAAKLPRHIAADHQVIVELIAVGADIDSPQKTGQQIGADIIGPEKRNGRPCTLLSPAQVLCRQIGDIVKRPRRPSNLFLGLLGNFLGIPLSVQDQ